MSDLSGIKNNWNVIKGKMREKYGILTDSDLTWVEGKHDDLLRKLNIILGIPKEELQKFIMTHEHSVA